MWLQQAVREAQLQENIAREIFTKLYNKIQFDGHSVAVWKNDLLEIAKEYGIILEENDE